jgi:hypothetical protein
VATRAHAGVGNVESFGDSHDGVDVDFDDQPLTTGANPRIVLDAKVGMGQVLITHQRSDAFDRHRGFRDFRKDQFGPQSNTGCEVR